MSDTDTSTAAPVDNEITAIVQSLEDAWNTGDGAGFAAAFAEDADFVNVYGMHVHGREAIRQGHEFILKGPYAGSRNRYTPESVRLLRPDVAVARVHAVLSIPGGPMAGEHQARWTAVLTEDGGRWQITAFHNTFISPPPGAPPR